MALTNAEKQAAFRKRQKDRMASLEGALRRIYSVSDSDEIKAIAWEVLK